MNDSHPNRHPYLFIAILTVALGLIGCNTGKDTVASDRVPTAQTTWQITVQFHGPEGLKRLPHRYLALQLEMVREISQNPLTVLFSLSCPRDHLAGHLYKLEQDDDVISAYPYE